MPIRSSRRRRRPRSPVRARAGVIGAVAGVAAVAGLTAALLHQHGAGRGQAGGSSDKVAASRSAPATPSAARTSTVPKSVPRVTRSATRKGTGSTRVPSTEALRKAVAGAPGAVSVSVADLTTGRTLGYGASGHSFACASIAKLDILASLLLQRQDKGTTLTSSEQALATKMIERSDNAAADSLYRTLGEAAGMDAANRRFGLGSTHGGRGILWGITTTTAADQVKLLRQVFTSASLLGSTDRDYIQGLLSQVETDQRWGVSAAATSDDYQLKNGWLPRTSTGLWVVNSTGRITRNGHRLLITVVSDGNGTEAQGISLIESVARAAASALVVG